MIIMASNYTRGLYNEYEILLTKNEKMESEFKLLRKEYQLLQRELLAKEKREAELFEEQSKVLKERDELIKENLRLTALLNTNGLNSGIPTSQTPIHKKKVIPNSREKSEKKIGGQVVHPKRKLEAFSENEITENERHNPESCPHCGSTDMEETRDTITKDELDYEFVVIKKRHHFPECRCMKCGRKFHQSIPASLKEDNQYGPNVQALALSLMNTGNVSVNKVRTMIYGLSEQEVNPSEGFIIKLQRRAAELLAPFMENLKNRCLSMEILYWDDTVVYIDTARGCLRYYGDDGTAMYVAHLHKDKIGLDDDGILKLLPAKTVVMHDHNKVNYNKDYSYTNIECNVHLLRDLQKTTDNLGHKWSEEMKTLLEKTNTERNLAIENGESEFSDAYVKGFFQEYGRIIIAAISENREDHNKYYGNDEQTLILRITEYKDNYFAWVTNFELPFSNNLSERSLRGVKSKMKISGQFQTEETAKNYAVIKSYVETCRRNGLNETEALVRLCEGNPYAIHEIFKGNSGE